MRPALSRGELDRAAHRRKDPEWLRGAWSRAKVLVVDPDSGAVPVHGEPPRLRFLRPDRAPAGERIYLGGEDQPFFAVIAPVTSGAGLREVGPSLSDFESALFVEALAVMRWHVDYRRHPADGTPLRSAAAGWELHAGEERSWPRTDPAVMVMISDGGDRCLLQRGLGWAPDRFSCVAGFVEPGESAEAACRREVSEEVGVAVEQLNYVASQPWPFPRSLMLGFEGVADPEQPLRLQPDEIAEARWFTREEVRDGLKLNRAPLENHSEISISRFLLTRWAE